METTALLLSLFVGSVGSAFVPVLNAEAMILGAALAAPEVVVPIALVGALGQMTGKVVLYLGGRGLGRLGDGEGRTSGPVRRWAGRLEGRSLLVRACLLSSASVGLPPLYVMAVLVGLAGIPLPTFLVLGVAGRFVRFYALALLPGLF